MVTQLRGARSVRKSQLCHTRSVSGAVFWALFFFFGRCFFFDSRFSIVFSRVSSIVLFFCDIVECLQVGNVKSGKGKQTTGPFSKFTAVIGPNGARAVRQYTFCSHDLPIKFIDSYLIKCFNRMYVLALLVGFLGFIVCLALHMCVLCVYGRF